MINGNPHDFVDTVYSGQDIIYVFRGIKYWFQGYTVAQGNCHMEIFQYSPPSETDIWECDAATMEACLNAFLDARIFDGKTFWEVESEIEWVDD
ncbi:MAG: hypothetical protein IJ229_00255 [Clostridia bacterium]|nr:hypothetical protein [Clostridia bacterium]